MHRCLKIDEVLQEIFSEVLIQDRSRMFELDRQKAPTVARLARTCRTFRGPALATLWREISGIAPLFNVLPTSKLRWVGPQTNDGGGFREFIMVSFPVVVIVTS
jgi:F-box-like